MRTKALLIGAAIGAIGLATSMAQVYSVNIVGYVNTTCPPGFKMIQNPLKCTLAGGNTLANILPNVTIPAGAGFVKVYKWTKVNGTLQYVQSTYDSEGWSNDQLVLNPGEGFFFYNPSPSTSTTLTFVGEVMTGTAAQLTQPIYTGFNMVGSMVPQAGQLETDLQYHPSGALEKIYYWDTTLTPAQYVIKNWNPDDGWVSGEPILPVGESVFIYHPSATESSWSRDFTIQ